MISRQGSLPKATPFAVGMHRAVYLWAGPGTVRMNRLKFMGAPVNEAAHREAHQPEGAECIVGETGFNWVYLMYDWGFPPEVAQEDWESFAQAVPEYHARGARVFGYVQTSNCVDAGTYRSIDWYARDPHGKRIHYYTGRYMTCLRDLEWIAHLEEMIRGILDAGADGVFLDNPWHGLQPQHLNGVWLGGAGCYCARCREAFREAHGEELPRELRPDYDEATRVYLQWRAGQVTRLVADLAKYAHTYRAGAFVSVNDYDAVMRPSYVVHGIDLPALARVQDVVMIENFALPRVEEGELVNNVLTLHTATAICGGTPVTTNPYDRGIGFDVVYSPRRFQQGMAEAAAAGCPMVVKGTEYVDERGAHTLLTEERYGEARAAIGGYHRWFQKHTALYLDRENAATVGVLYPEDVLWENWDAVAPLYFGAGQALLAAGIPWRVVRETEGWDELSHLIVTATRPHLEKQFRELAGRAEDLTRGGRVVWMDRLAGWGQSEAPFLARHARVRKGMGVLANGLYNTYFESRVVRKLLDRYGVVPRLMRSPHFRLPSAQALASFRQALGPVPAPQVTCAGPVLIEAWREADGKLQLHLVNYGSRAVDALLRLPWAARVHAISPDPVEFGVSTGEAMPVHVDVYSIVVAERVTGRRVEGENGEGLSAPRSSGLRGNVHP